MWRELQHRAYQSSTARSDVRHHRVATTSPSRVSDYQTASSGNAMRAIG